MKPTKKRIHCYIPAVVYDKIAEYCYINNKITVTELIVYLLDSFLGNPLLQHRLITSESELYPINTIDDDEEDWTIG